MWWLSGRLLLGRGRGRGRGRRRRGGLFWVHWLVDLFKGRCLFCRAVLRLFGLGHGFGLMEGDDW